jgi:uncharacterized protein YndB with AHSA1/START domain/effector-binding domain-containing protein
MSEKKLEIIVEPGKPSFITRRVVDAPRELVFETFTKSEHLKRWMGPRAFPMILCEQDLRVGGSYRFVHRAPDGQEIGFRGKFLEVVPPERLVRTYVFEPMPEHEAVETLLLEERNGKTTITTTTVHKTIEGRDGHLSGGMMEAGMTDGYARLDELLVELKNRSLEASGVPEILDPPQILQTAVQSTAVIHLTIPRSEIQKVMGPGLNELRATLAAQGIAARGPWFTRHLKMDPQIFDFEIGLCVDQPVTAQGRVAPGQLPGGTVARTVYRGPYEGLHSAWSEFGKWIAAHGHQGGPSLWETYLTDPSTNPDPSTYRTELTKPLVQ